MARTNGLDVARLRQLARVGAEVTLDRLRAEIAAPGFWGKRVEAIIANKRDAKVLTFRPRM